VIKPQKKDEIHIKNAVFSVAFFHPELKKADRDTTPDPPERRDQDRLS